MNKSYQNLQTKNLPNREVEIEAVISQDTMAEMYRKALEKIKKTFEADGFRTGNVPEHIISQKVGEMKILEEAAEMALSKVYPEILKDEKIDAIGRPEITITKIALNNPLSFRIKTAIAPQVRLADYKKIAESAQSQKIEKIEITEKEIDDVMLDVRKNVAHTRLHQNEKLGEHEHNHKEITDADLPEVDEQFLKEIGGFASLSDLRAKIKENIYQEKEAKAKDKKRSALLEEIVRNSSIEIPKIFIDSELERMLGQFKNDIARSSIEYSEYLAHIKKSEDDLKKEWRETAEKRAKSQIVLHTISKEQNIAPTEENIKKEMDIILQHNKDADRFQVRMFVENFLTNELVFQFLENMGPISK